MTFFREKSKKPGNPFSVGPHERDSRALRLQTPPFQGAKAWMMLVRYMVLLFLERGPVL